MLRHGEQFDYGCDFLGCDPNIVEGALVLNRNKQSTLL